MDTISVYTDGATKRNGRKDAHSGCGVYFSKDHPSNKSIPLPIDPQTNQRAELYAIYTTIKCILDINELPKEVKVFTDSMYSIKSLTEWSLTWERNGWMTSKNTPVCNQDIIQPTLELIKTALKRHCQVTFHHVRGHSGNFGNDAADRLAVQATNEYE